jgi:hypothetical protein
MVLPALMSAVFLTRSRNLLIALAFLSALVEVALFLSLRYPQALNLWMIWVALGWLLWYLAATSQAGWPQSVSKTCQKLYYRQTRRWISPP